MNKKGMAAFYLFMVGVVFFVLGLALAPALNDVIQGEGVRGSNGLDCSNTSISNQNKAVCYQVDAIPPLFVALIFGFGGIIITRLIG